MTSEQKTISGSVYTTGWAYNSADLPTTMSYPDSEVVTYTYDARMLLNSVAGTDNYVPSSAYDSAGRLTNRALGNGLSQSYIFHPWTTQGGRLQNLTAGTLQDYTYTYDAVGNITQIQDAITTETQAFGYDRTDRLTIASVTNGPAPYSEAYDYGANGKLSSKAGLSYTYDVNHPHAVSAYAGNTYGYDANGNQTSRVIGGLSYTLGYDAEGRLVSVTGPTAVASFVYDGDGKRVKSTINGVTTSFVGSYYEVTASVVTKYYYAGAQRVGMRMGGVLFYLLGDHLGSTSLTTDSSGTLLSELRYKAWGEVRYGFGVTPTKYTFTGQYSNVSEFGLLFYNARWYDPALGHFAQADSIVPGAGSSGRGE